MMSKNCFLAKTGTANRLKENLKRRSWTILLGLLGFLLVLPVKTAMELSQTRRLLGRDKYHYGTAMTPDEILKNTCMESLTFDGLLLAFVLLLAVLLAIQGFSWIDSRKKLDLYMSVPVSSGKRYRVVYLNGLGIFCSCYLVSLLLALLAAWVMGVMSLKVLGAAFLAFLCNLLFFTACYNLVLIAVMLTGNVLVTLAGTMVLFLYEYLIRQVFRDLLSTYFRTYCQLNQSRMIFTSPLFSYTEGAEYMNYLLSYESGGARHTILQSLCVTFLQALVYGVCAFLLFRMRRAESAGKAMAFGRSKDAVKLLLMIPATLALGLWFRSMSGGEDLFTLLGMLVGLLLSHGLIQVIYEFDVRSILKKKWHILAAGAVSAGIFLCFYFDLTGYDSYVPGLSDVEAVAFTFENDIYGLNRYEAPFTPNMEYENRQTYMMEHMKSEEEKTIEAVRRLAVMDQEKGADRTEYNAGYVPASIRYHLKNGGSVCRTIMVELETSAEWMDVIFADDDFQTTRYQVKEPLFEEHAAELEIQYSDGLEEVTYMGDAAGLIRAYAQNLKKYSFSMMMEELPVGRLTFCYYEPGRNDGYGCVWYYPVYSSFTETAELLREQGIYTEPAESGSLLDSGKVSSITITCYNLLDSDVDFDYDGTGSVSYTEDREKTETFTDPDEIARILPAVYPEVLEDVSGARLTGQLSRGNYEVTVVFKNGVNYKYTRYGFFVLENRLPGFVKEKLVYKE